MAAKSFGHNVIARLTRHRKFWTRGIRSLVRSFPGLARNILSTYGNQIANTSPIAPSRNESWLRLLQKGCFGALQTVQQFQLLVGVVKRILSPLTIALPQATSSTVVLVRHRSFRRYTYRRPTTVRSYFIRSE